MASKNSFIPITPEWQKCDDIDGAPTFEEGKSYVIQAIGAYGYTLLCEATEKPSEDYKGGLRRQTQGARRNVNGTLQRYTS
ncbi:MAG: hypothetical protein J6Z08_00625 [Elusimicrobiales bacterium]|nr:hypothetical protein [Elusimicrobiales bacterium]